MAPLLGSGLSHERAQAGMDINTTFMSMEVYKARMGGDTEQFRLETEDPF